MNEQRNTLLPLHYTPIISYRGNRESINKIVRLSTLVFIFAEYFGSLYLFIGSFYRFLVIHKNAAAEFVLYFGWPSLGTMRVSIGRDV